MQKGYVNVPASVGTLCAMCGHQLRLVLELIVGHRRLGQGNGRRCGFKREFFEEHRLRWCSFSTTVSYDPVRRLRPVRHFITLALLAMLLRVRPNTSRRTGEVLQGLRWGGQSKQQGIRTDRFFRLYCCHRKEVSLMEIVIVVLFIVLLGIGLATRPKVQKGRKRRADDHTTVYGTSADADCHHHHHHHHHHDSGYHSHHGHGGFDGGGGGFDGGGHHG